MGDDLKLMDWLHTAMWPMERVLTSELACDATALSCVEYIRSGITTYADQFYFAKDIAPVAVQSGLRCFLAATVFENGCAETEDTPVSYTHLDVYKRQKRSSFYRFCWI